jgi:hypothetical protein
MEREARGFPAVSMLDAEPTWQGRREGGPRRAEVSKGEVEGRGKNSIFRLRYRIASHTCYIGNRVPSPKHETDKHHRRERAGEKVIHV